MNSDRLRVVLVGQGPTAATALRSLVERFEVAALVRGTDDELTGYARSIGVPVRPDATVAGLRAVLSEVEPDAVVVSSFDRILPADLLADRPFVNVHYAPLPRYRGRATVNWAILNGEPAAAISIHTLAPGLDAGNILYQEQVPIGPTDTVTDLYDRLNDLQRKHLADALARHLAGDAGQPQDESQATYACGRVPDDGLIDWSAGTLDVYRLIRALAPPFPGAFTHLGLRRMWIVRAQPREDAPRYEGRVPGRVVGRSAADGWVDVLTADGIMRLHEARLDGDEVRPAAELLRSVRQTLGLRPQELLDRIAELEARCAAAAAEGAQR